MVKKEVTMHTISLSMNVNTFEEIKDKYNDGLSDVGLQTMQHLLDMGKPCVVKASMTAKEVGGTKEVIFKVEIEELLIVAMRAAIKYLKKNPNTPQEALDELARLLDEYVVDMGA